MGVLQFRSQNSQQWLMIMQLQSWTGIHIYKYWWTVEYQIPETSLPSLSLHNYILRETMYGMHRQKGIQCHLKARTKLCLQYHMIDITTGDEGGVQDGNVWRVVGVSTWGLKYCVLREKSRLAFPGKWDHRGETSVRIFVLRALRFVLFHNLMAPSKPHGETLNDLFMLMMDQFQPQPITITEWFIFHQWCLGPDETISKYMAELLKLASTCDFGKIHNQTIWWSIICHFSG